MVDLPILILAAGQSSRMRGVDKLFEPVDGVAVLRRQIDAALAVSRNVFVALPETQHPRAGLLAGTSAQPIVVSHAADGIGVTLREAVAQLPPCPAFMVVLADLVALEAADFEALILARDAQPDHLIWRGATQAGKPGHPILFDHTLRGAFKTLDGDTGGAPILRAHAERTCLVPLPGDRALLDLDTPEDWAAWRTKTGR